MIAQARSDDQAHHLASRTSNTSTSASASSTTTAAASSSSSNEGWGAYMQRQLQERTEKLNIMGDSMQNLEQNSAGWADDVGKFVSRQKKGAVTGLIKHKFGF
jgi:syntaxin-binding protein 5